MSKEKELQTIISIAGRVEDSLKRSIKDVSAELERMQKAVNDSMTETDKLSETINEQAAELEKAKKKYMDYLLSGEKNSEQAKETKKEISNLSKELKDNKARMSAAEKAADSLDQSLEEVKSSSKGAGDGFTVMKGTLSNLVSNGIQALITKAKEAAGVLLDLGKQALFSYADYQQLEGGVETLFGSGGQSLEEYAASIGKTVAEAAYEYRRLQMAQANVLEYADGAYKSAGLSTNDYRETVTGFSASLVSSLGGDTLKAAEYANLAITDMADNANKMGTDIESLQSAYEGFAKENFSLLDNLKLGYSGTKEGMKELLADAQKLTGENYDISSYADIIAAIHDIQTEMGITGTTAEEAEGTISGSISSMKAAWTNLLTGMANGNADIPKLVQAVVESGKKVLENILPAVKEIIKNIPVAISEIDPEVGEVVQGLVDTAASAFSVIKNVIGWAAEHQDLLKGIAVAVGMVTAALGVLNTILTIQSAIMFASPTTWIILGIVAAVAALIAIGVALCDQWDNISTTASEMISNVKTKFSDGFSTLQEIMMKPFQSVMNIIDKVKNAIGSITDKVSSVGSGIASTVSSVIPGYATGGFTSGLSFAGEEGTEAVISFDPAYRSQNLSYWAKAGRMLGALDASYSLGGADSSGYYFDMGGIEFSPNIVIHGNADKESIMEAIEAEYPEFVDLLEKWFAERGVPVYG